MTPQSRRSAREEKPSATDVLLQPPILISAWPQHPPPNATVLHETTSENPKLHPGGQPHECISAGRIAEHRRSTRSWYFPRWQILHSRQSPKAVGMQSDRSLKVRVDLVDREMIQMKGHQSEQFPPERICDIRLFCKPTSWQV